MPKGGPSGGNGGRGGHVYCEGDAALNSLTAFRRQVHFRCGAGGGRSARGGAGNKQRARAAGCRRLCSIAVEGRGQSAACSRAAAAAAGLTGAGAPARRRAEPGTPGGGSDMHGAAGPDLVVRVPPGTIVRRKGAAPGEPPLAEVLRPGERVG